MSLQLLDWRRRVTCLYDDVRRVAESDSEHAWHRWCVARDELFRTHPQSPVAGHTDFPGLSHAPYDAALRFEATVRPAPPEVMEVATTDPVPVRLERIGRVHLDVGTLDVWWLAQYGGGLFLPFADATNGTETYGGGRYLLDTAKGADLGGTPDRLIVDFNFAYNPSCAYSPSWVCPLPPPGNRLDAEIRAGELAPR